MMLSAFTLILPLKIWILLLSRMSRIYILSYSGNILMKNISVSLLTLALWITKHLMMIKLLPQSFEISGLSHYLTDYNPYCHDLCYYIGRSAFNNLIYMLSRNSTSFTELGFRVITACKSLFSIRDLKK